MMPRGFPLHVAGRAFNRPLAVERDWGLGLISSLAGRFGVTAMQTDTRRLDGADLDDASNGFSWVRGAQPYPVSDRVAVIGIEGTLLHRYGSIGPWCGVTGYDGIVAQVHEAERDPAILGVVLDIHSPGGEVDGCFVCARRIRALAQRKPVLAMVNEVACSAAYALAAAAGNIVAPPGARVGSIGVWTMHADFSRALDKDGITITMIAAGAHKIDGHPYAALPDAVRETLQAEVETTRTAFAAQVAEHRKLSAEAVLGTEAAVLSAEEALAAGLIDAIADPVDAYDDFIAALDAEPAPAASAASKA